MAALSDPSILVVDDNLGLGQLMAQCLRREGYPTAHIDTGAGALRWLERGDARLMLLDLKLPDIEGDELLHRLGASGRDVPFVVVSGHGDERSAVDMMKRGAIDYLMKDASLLELLPGVVRRALEHVEQRRKLRKAEAECRSLQERYEQLLSAAGEGILGLDRDGRITYSNPAAERLLGYDHGGLLGLAYGSLVVHADVLTGFGPPAASFSRGIEQRLIRRDGATLSVETTSTAVKHDDTLTGSVLVFRDITQRLHREEQSRQSQKLEAIGRLASGVAHDFNNLLTVIAGYGELLERNPSLDDRAREAAGEVQAAATRAAALTRQLLTFSRKQDHAPTVCEAAGLVSDIGKLLRRVAGDTVAVTLDLAADAPAVRIDRTQFEQVLVNVVANARDAMPAGGEITVRARRDDVSPAHARSRAALRPGPHARFDVTDTGVGMDAATRERAFEPFFTTKEPGRGTGLGLALAYGVIAQSGGHVEIDSAVGVGTTFTIWLPEADTDVPRRATFAYADPPRGGNETILVVEDDPALRALAGRTLTHLGYRVLLAVDGPDALAMAATEPLHLLVADVMLPRMSGPEVARRIGEQRAGLRVLFMSGHGDAVVLDDAPPKPGTGFLSKPFGPAQLAQQVRALLDEPASA